MPQLLVSTIVMKDTASVLIGKAKDGVDAGLWVIPGGFLTDGEKISEASERIMREETGLSIVPKQMLFLSEIVKPEDHRVAAFILAESGSTGEPQPGPSLTEVKFVDPRELGKYQADGMSPLAIDAFVKFAGLLNLMRKQVTPEAGTTSNLVN